MVFNPQSFLAGIAISAESWNLSIKIVPRLKNATLDTQEFIE